MTYQYNVIHNSNLVVKLGIILSLDMIYKFISRYQCQYLYFSCERRRIVLNNQYHFKCHIYEFCMQPFTTPTFSILINIVFSSEGDAQYKIVFEGMMLFKLFV